MMRSLANSIGVIGALLALSACARAGLRELPDEPPSIVGQVTAVTPVAGERWGSIRVEERPADASGSAKASVRLEESAAIFRGGKKVDFTALEVGQWVRVWFRGPVAESYPVQAMGGAVAIDSLPR